MSINTRQYAKLIISVVLITTAFGCGDRGKERGSAQEQLNQAMNKVGGRLDGGDEAFRDLMGSIGKKLDEISKTSSGQQQLLERTLKDYEIDRQQIQGVFGSIADRLDQVDKSISNLQNRYQEMDKKFQGLDVVGNNKGSE